MAMIQVSRNPHENSSDDFQKTLARYEFENHIRSVVEKHRANEIKDMQRRKIYLEQRTLSQQQASFPACYPETLSSDALEVCQSMTDVAGAVAEFSGLNRESIVNGILEMVAIATQGTFEVLCGQEWKEYFLLNTIIIADSGERKGALMSFLQAPINEFMQNENKRFALDLGTEEEQRQRFQAAKKIANAMQNITIGSSLKGSGGHLLFEKFDSLVNEVAGISKTADRYVPASMLRLFTDNATSAGFHKTCYAQNGRLALVSTEGGVLTKSAFVNGDLPELIKNSYSGESFTRENMRKLYHYERPFVPIFMTTQPSQLLRFYGIEKFQNDGLLSRIVPCFSIGLNPNGELCIDGARKVYSKVIKFILTATNDAIKSEKCFKNTSCNGCS